MAAIATAYPGVRLRLARGLAERQAKGDVKGVVSDTQRPQRLSDIFVTPGAGMGIQRRAGGGDVRARLGSGTWNLVASIGRRR
jgi:hypothetical protein